MSESLETTPTEPEPQSQETVPEPEGLVEVQGQKMVPVAALVAERERARAAEREKVTKELEPLRQKAEQADKLGADVAAMRPYVEYLQQHPELLQQPVRPDQPTVSDEDAEKYARRYELYTPTGLDLTRAKQIIADNRADMDRVARQAAQEAVQPVMHGTAVTAARQNFLWAATQKDATTGQPLVDPAVLANVWARVPPDLAQHPEVARHLLQTAIGEAAMSGRRPIDAPAQEPTFSEPAGGPTRGPYAITDLERRMARTAGINEKDWTARAQTYKPDAINVLGD